MCAELTATGSRVIRVRELVYGAPQGHSACFAAPARGSGCVDHPMCGPSLFEPVMKACRWAGEGERERERESATTWQLPHAPMAVKLNDQPALESDGCTNNCTTAITRCNSRENIPSHDAAPTSQLVCLVTSNVQAKGEPIVSARLWAATNATSNRRYWMYLAASSICLSAQLGRRLQCRGVLVL